MKRNFVEILVVVLISILILLLITLSSDLMTKSHVLYYNSWMHFGYIKTVKSFPDINLTAPFCWRLLAPFLVYIFPFSIETGYLLVTFSSIVASSVLVYFIAKHLFTELYYPWIGVLTYFSLIFVVRMNVIEFISVDSLAFMFMLLSIYSIYKKNNLLFIISTTLGILTKETLFIVFPLYFTLNYRSHYNRGYYYNLIYRTFLVSLPAIIIYIFLRILIIPKEPYNYFELLTYISKYRFDSILGLISTLNKNLFVHQNAFENILINIYRITFGAIGPIIFFIILKSKANLSNILRLSPLIVLSFLQIFIAIDNERLIMTGFPAYVLLYLYSIYFLVKENNIDIKYFIIYSIINLISQFVLTKDYYQQTYYSVVLQLILGLLMLAVIYMKFYIRSSKQYKREKQTEQ